LPQQNFKLMRKNILLLCLAVIASFSSIPAFAQETMRGTVYFQQIDKFEFEPTGRPELDQYAKSLPSEFKFAKVLHFSEKASLFEKTEDPNVVELSRRERHLLHRSKYGKQPKPEAEKIYCDFEKEKKIELLEFMTRVFLVEGEMEKNAWKFLNTPKKILDYTCMAAETNMEEDVITAWFTPQIPIPAGPDKYYGLPGMIMAVEKNGETIYLATAIEMNPEEDLLIEPKEGKKVTQEKLDKIIEEKIKEFKSQGKGMGHGRGRHH